MAEITVKRTISAPLSEVWASWDSFGEIDRFNPNLKSSHLINNSSTTGEGAMRQCNLADGKNYIRERIVNYEPEKRMVIDIYEGTMPLKNATATLSFDRVDVDKTEVNMKMEFTPKMGILGKILIPVMKPQFRKMLNGLLAGNAAFIERGVIINAAT